ncbi:MAG: hypothetical protein R3E39_23630 [Anaerolineae bacterium]
MQYTLIKGTYYVVGHSPDGDSIKFKANNPELWKKINTDNRDVFEQSLAANDGVVMLRLQGVDALETHYAPPKPSVPDDLKGKVSATLAEPPYISLSQPSLFGKLAAETFLKLLGFTDARWRNTPRGSYITEVRIMVNNVSTPVKEKWKDGVPGTIVTGDMEKNGRPISWVFAGEAPVTDGSPVSNDQLAELATGSTNYQLLKMGLIHPLYYMTLAGKLRRKLDEAVQIAQQAAANTPTVPNIWLADQSTKGITLTTLKALTDELIIYPDLFRRILRHYQANQMRAYWNALRANASSYTPPATFALNSMFEGANPYMFVVSDQDFVRLADILEVSENSLRMKKSPHDLVFLS